MTPTVGGMPVVKRGRTEGLRRWAKSSACRAHARRQAEANNDRFRARPRCGAKRKGDGKPCTQPALKGRKRCRHHGGVTPAGAAWHVVQYPDCSTPAGVARFNRKIRQQQRYAKQRAERLAKFTPEQRAAYDAWHQARRPGLTKAARAAKRERVRRDSELRDWLARPPPNAPVNSEVAGLAEALATAKAELARIEGRNAAGTDGDRNGVFG